MKSNKIILFIIIILAALTGYFIYTYTTGTIKHELRDFAIKDTTSVTKIFLADRRGNKSLLTKISAGKWMLNEKYPVANGALNTLLYTLMKMEVRSPVGKAAYNTVMKTLITDGVKVEVYQNNELAKTFYVGGPTQDMFGTFMYLQNSSAPFVMHIPGFDGYLTTRFIVIPEQWKSKLIFSYGQDDIKRIVVNLFPDTTLSFRMQRNGDHYDYFNPPSSSQPKELSLSKQAAYINNYRKIGYEREDYGLHYNIKDSILKTHPTATMEVEDMQGNITHLTMYRKPTTEGALTSIDERTGKLRPFDPDRMFAKINNDTNFVVLQYNMFDPLFKKPELIK